METHIWLKDIAIITTVAVFSMSLLERFRLPAVAGLLLSGAFLGPYGFQLVRDPTAIEFLAEVGVVLLLFTIGLEFSFSRLRDIFARVALGGLLQVGGTTAVVAWIASAWGFSMGTSILYGFLFALSSTAIVLRILSDRQELDAPHGRFIVGTLIFQDLCVIPMVLLIPILAKGGGKASAVGLILLAVGKAVCVMGLVAVLSRMVVPKLLSWMRVGRSREGFLLTVITLCIGTAWLTSLMGLSLALGAFLGGMVVADTEFRHRALGDILPLKDIFVSVFFVSLGMFFHPLSVVEAPYQTLLLLAGFIFAKGLLATVAALAMRFPPRAAWLAGVGLAQFSEFGFVLARLGIREGLVEPASLDPLFNAGIISMFLTPLLVVRAPKIKAGEDLLAPLAKLFRARGVEELDHAKAPLKNHVVIAGYGLAGRMVARSLRNMKIDHAFLELNVDNVREGQAQGDSVFYADSTSEEALRHAHVEQARAVLVLINDPQAIWRVIDTVRRIAPKVHLMVRTRHLTESQNILRHGATDVVADEVEGGIEILARLLRTLEIPRNILDLEIHDAREASQKSERSLVVPRPLFSSQSDLADMKIESVLVVAGSMAIGKSLKEINLRQETGALIVAVKRGAQLLSHPDPSQLFQEGDVVYLIGDLTSVRQAVDLLGTSIN